MRIELADNVKEPLVQLLLALADDKLMLGHRNSDWTGLAPILEEDIAFSSIAQDEIAHASALYQWLGAVLERRADELAFGRSAAQYRCASIVELSDRFDWAVAIARQFFCDHFDAIRLERLARTSVKELAALCSRLLAEERVHVEHVDAWIRRLGEGTSESADLLQSALNELAPHAAMLWEPVPDQEALESSGVYPPLSGGVDPYQRWVRELEEVAGSAGLRLSLPSRPPQTSGGRRGRHVDEFDALLNEMCEVYRLEPSAAW